MAAMVVPPNNLLGMTLTEMEALFASWGEPRFRARQVYGWIYKKAAACSEMKNLPAPLRARLEREAPLAYPEIAATTPSADGAVKYLLRLADGERIEAVFMPTPGHDTLCISSQAGCAMDCKFCATATLGLGRHLTAGEMVGEVLVMRRALKLTERRLNVLFMGEGEPLHNYDATVRAVRLLCDAGGVGLSPRRVTVSTVGLVPAIEKLAQEDVRPNLAVSLNAATDEVRNRIMPINKKYPIAALIEAVKKYPRDKRIDVTFEYVLFRGVNDSLQDAKRLSALARRADAKVNLIAYNEVEGLPFQRPSDAEVLVFQRVVREGDVQAFIRKPRGRDIAGACGQLRLEEKSAAA